MAADLPAATAPAGLSKDHRRVLPKPRLPSSRPAGRQRSVDQHTTEMLQPPAVARLIAAKIEERGVEKLFGDRVVHSRYEAYDPQRSLSPGIVNRPHGRSSIRFLAAHRSPS